MCCFSGPVRSVENTRIFARRTGPATQALVYQMHYASDAENAMILPLPVRTPAADDAVRFIDIKDYDRFFEDLAEGFPVKPPFQLIRSKGAAEVAASASPLRVEEVGDYVASFVPTIADFERLDPRFRIAPDIWSKIPGYSDYGFAVFQLQKKSGTPHPMALEFPTRLEGIFFPTVHIHDGAVHAEEHFDHTLYLQDPSFDAAVGDYEDHDVLDYATDCVRSDQPAGGFAQIDRAKGLLDAGLLVHKRELEGKLDNRDQILELAQASIVPPGVRKWGFRVGPALVVAAGLGFIIARRRKRAREIAAARKAAASDASDQPSSPLQARRSERHQRMRTG